MGFHAEGGMHMDRNEAREAVVLYGRRLAERGLTVGTGGNLSVRVAGEPLVALKPSGVPYEVLTPSDVPLLDLEGRVVEGERTPSSEWRMHLGVYRARSDAGGVVHTHSRFATTLACLKWEIPAAHYLVAASGDELVPVAPYRTFGSPELAEEAVRALGARGKAVLLANHGLLALGADLGEAFGVAEQIEFVAELYWRARCVGEPALLSREETREALEAFRNYASGRSA